MRIYIPVKQSDINAQRLDVSEVFAVTPGLEAIIDPPITMDELEELARSLAAQASLHTLVKAAVKFSHINATDLPMRRVVAAADIYGELDEIGPGCVQLREPLPWQTVVSVHCDDDVASQYWRSELVKNPPPNAADDTISQWISTLEHDFEMDWYDITELATVRALCANDPQS
ncbi:MAG: hypothetical protein Q4P66_04195 [Actinomycetaceae bacterium]|nr:hypothetical protein [Actinomycetaceae bacterium]